MYLKCNRRVKDGKEHRYWSIMENRRCAGGRVVQRPVLYLGEINDSQREAWIRSIEVFDEDHSRQDKLSLFASDRPIPEAAADAIGVRLSEFVLRDGIDVKLCPQEVELYVLAQSRDRIGKERSMRRRALRKLLKRLAQLRAMPTLNRDQLLLKLGAAKSEAGRAYHLVDIRIPEPRQALTPETFYFSLNRGKLREARRREGRYLLRSNLCGDSPEKLWELYMQLCHVEEAFKDLKGDLGLRPIYHQCQQRIEAHIFVAFLAYCIQVTLRHRLRLRAPGLTPRAVIEKLPAIQMLDAWFPTTDGRWLIFARYTQPEKDHRLLLAQLNLELPPQRPPRIKTKGELLSA